MRVQFCTGGPYDVIAEFDVTEMPTEEQCKIIEDEIYEAMEKWEEETGDIDGFDYWGVCYAAVKKHLKIVDNQVVKTFYL
jgi:hypothetical protein